MIITLNEKQGAIVRPLLEWGILGYKELYELSAYPNSYESFRRLVGRMDSSGIIETFYFSLMAGDSLRKFSYLSRDAFKELCDERRPYLDLTIKNHEATLSNIMLGFKRNSSIGEAYLHKKGNFLEQKFFNDRIDADGVITARIEDRPYMIAIEAELNRKSSDRIFEKFKRYYLEAHYDAAIYFFSSRYIRDAYFSYHLKFLKEADIEQGKSIIFFAYSPYLSTNRFDPLTSEVLRRDGEPILLASFFNQKMDVTPASPPCNLGVTAVSPPRHSCQPTI